MLDYHPNFQFTYNGKRLYLNDASDWAFFTNKLFNGAYDNTLVNIHGMDDWEDSVFPWEKEEKKRNPLSRKGRNRKARQNGKRNADKAKRLHKADRYHGKGLESYLYKEDGIIKESIEMVWHRCRMPVSDKAHDHSALKAKAREQEYFYTPSISERELEEEDRKEMQKIENYNTLLSALNNLEKGKYIFLLSYWNGRDWEEHESAAFEFNGVISHDSVKERIFKENKNHFGLPEMEMDTVHDIQGMSIMWHGYYEEGEGYVKYTFLPISKI